jgi:hypothetical protein
MPNMQTVFAPVALAATLLTALTVSAHATPNCLKDRQPYEFVDDTVSWVMTIAPGTDCIQGLRWSYMQIETVSLSRGPKNGNVVIVGSGFRFFANSENRGTDSFTLVVFGKKGRDAGKSTIEITVNQQLGIQTSNLAK